jgi:hypothetical protein
MSSAQKLILITSLDLGVVNILVIYYLIDLKSKFVLIVLSTV